MGRRGKKSRKIEKGETEFKVKNKILLHTIKLCNSEFFMIDLDTGEVKKCLQNLKNDSGICSMVALGKVIYLIGDHRYPSSDNSKIQVSYSDLDLGDGDGVGWKKAPSLITFDRCVLPESHELCGKIYVFGYSNSEVFDPLVNEWNILPKPPHHADNFSFVKPVLVDPPNRRFFMCFKPTGSLYAYYPGPAHANGRCRWELVVEKMRFWAFRLAYEDGVIYFYLPGPMNNVIKAAFDVEAKQWLNVVYSSSFDQMALFFEFDDLLNLGKGFMCLVVHAVLADTYNSCMYAVKFRVQRRSPTEVLVTPFPGRYYHPHEPGQFGNYLAL